VQAHVERVFREVHGQAVATLVSVFGDITLAEDAVQDAFVTATDRWRSDGIPPTPIYAQPGSPRWKKIADSSHNRSSNWHRFDGPKLALSGSVDARSSPAVRRGEGRAGPYGWVTILYRRVG